MAKIVLNDLTSLANDTSAVNSLNTNFTSIETELQDKVLYRDNPTGEPNAMQNDLDMNSNDILNANNVYADSLYLNGQQVETSATTVTPSSISRELKTTAGGETSFTLTSITYTPGANSLFVYRDGIKLRKDQDYSETSSTVVTPIGMTIAADEEWEFMSVERSVEGTLAASSVTYTSNGASYNVADKLARYLDVEDFGGDGEAAALAAYAAGVPLLINTGETVKLVCDPTGGDDIQAMVAWMRSCIVSGDATFYMEIADGVHTVSTYIDLDGVGPDIDIRGTAAPDFIQINSYSYSSVSGTIYQIDVGVDSALPSGAVVGGVIGIQNAQGTLDIEGANGAHIITSIAGDRLSFTVEINSVYGAPSNGVLDNTLTNGLTANQAVVYKSCIIAQSTGWDGSSREGFINVLNGAQMIWRYVGLGYSGTAGTEHDLIFCRGHNSRFYGYDYSAFAGAGDKVLRTFGQAELYLNRCQVGGSNTAQELYQGSGGGQVNLIRVSFGSATVGGFTAGSACNVVIQQSQGGSTLNGFRPIAPDACITAYPVRLKNCTTGVQVTSGAFYGASTTEIEQCGTGLSWADGGSILGAISLSGNSTDSIADVNTWYTGGIWRDGSEVTLTTQDLQVSSSNPNIQFIDSGTSGASINANSGHLYFDTLSTSRDIYLQAAGTSKFQFDTSASSILFVAQGIGIYTGSGTPEGVVTANVGSTFHRTDGGAGTSFYVKESGTGNTGWVAK